ncbi:MAG: type ISP restriction/modification enzyme, partial [Brumimicrobium sp.]
VFHYDLFGKREMKYDFLSENSLRDVEFKELAYNKPYYFFVPKDDLGRELYEKGFKVSKLFPNNTSGIVTMGDGFIIADTKEELHTRINDFLSNDYSEIELKQKYSLGKNYGKWILENKAEIEKIEIKPVVYSNKPFDNKFTIFDNKLLWRWRDETMKHLFNKDNIALVISRQCADNWKYVFCTKTINSFNLTGTAGRYGSGYTCPLYLYPETNGQQTIEQTEERKPNLKAEIVNQIAENLGLTFTNEKETTENTFAPIDILDYIYAVLHSPTYREKYKEFLKIDFPRVPYPKDQDTFWQLVKLGGEIRQIHLLESPTVEQYITQYPIDGDNVVSRKITKGSPGYVADNETHGKVYINDEQYFDNVPLTAWEFYIGGYQPAQKWLKDRQGRTLEFDDILHYQKIIVALSETDRLMKEIDKIEFM